MVKAALVAVSLAVALVTSAHLSANPVWMTDILDTCLASDDMASLGTFYPTRVWMPDVFLCFITPVFEAVVSDQLGAGILLHMTGTVIAVGLITSLEASRSLSRLSFVTPATFLVGQLAGLAATFPMIFLPVFFYGRQTVGRLGAAPSILSAILTATIAANIAVLTVATSSLKLLIAVFQISPVILLFIPLLASASPSSLVGDGTVMACVCYAAAVVAAGLHWLAIYMVFSIAPTSQVWALAFRSATWTGPNSAQAFLLIDTLSLCASLLVLACGTCRSAGQFLGTLLLSVFAGPSAAVLRQVAANESGRAGGQERDLQKPLL